MLTNLVAALARLQVNDFPHLGKSETDNRKGEGKRVRVCEIDLA